MCVLSIKVPIQKSLEIYLMILVFKWNVQNNGKIWILCVDKALLSDGKKYCLSKAMTCSVLFGICSVDMMIFKLSPTDTNDAECSSCPNLAVVLENTRKHNKSILADCKLKLREIAEKLKISEGSVFTILHDHLSIRKLC